MALTFEQARAQHHEQNAIGTALADAAWERGDRLTPTEQSALAHWSRWGSDGYPVCKLGRKWTIDHAAYRGGGLFATKRAAVAAWEILIAKWVRMAGLEAYERTIQERSQDVA